MTLSVYLGFCLASLLLALAPGPDNLFVLVQSAVNGPKAGLVVVLGLVSGLVAQTCAAALGVAAVVAASPVLFWGIRLLGAAYLLYLAFMSWTHPVAGEQKSAAISGFGPLWRRGLIMNVTNPKVQIFFLAFFPQFVTKGASTLQTAAEMAVLGVTFMAATALVFGAIALLAGS
ncbi:MAG: LysE family translocator, partial [Duodenibacillus sp.]|nr:LysE family translocator [Duodenibacillus sp.]